MASECDVKTPSGGVADERIFLQIGGSGAQLDEGTSVPARSKYSPVIVAGFADAARHVAASRSAQSPDPAATHVPGVHGERREPQGRVPDSIWERSQIGTGRNYRWAHATGRSPGRQRENRSVLGAGGSASIQPG